MGDVRKVEVFATLRATMELSCHEDGKYSVEIGGEIVGPGGPMRWRVGVEHADENRTPEHVVLLALKEVRNRLELIPRRTQCRQEAESWSTRIWPDRIPVQAPPPGVSSR